jgi:hypothetical protein
VPVARAIERHVGGKRFRLDEGEWIDTSFDPRAMLPEAGVDSYEARSALLREKPRLAPYARLGSRVTVVFDGMVYRFDVK